MAIECAELKRHCGEHLPGFVVQLTGHAGPLRLLGTDGAPVAVCSSLLALVGRLQRGRLGEAGPLVGCRPCIRDGHGCLRRQRDGDALILLGKWPALAISQVQVAEYLTAQRYRNAQEGLHGWVPSGESRRCRVTADVLHPKGPRVGDELAEQSTTARELADVHGGGVVKTRPDEPREGFVIGRQHAERRVARTHHTPRRLHHAPQDGVQIEPPPDDHSTLHEGGRALHHPCAGNPHTGDEGESGEGFGDGGVERTPRGCPHDQRRPFGDARPERRCHCDGGAGGPLDRRAPRLRGCACQKPVGAVIPTRDDTHVPGTGQLPGLVGHRGFHGVG